MPISTPRHKSMLTCRTTRVLAAASLFRCNSGGDVISRVEFNGSDCSGTMDVSSYDLTGGPAFPDDGDWYFTCTCVPEVPGQTEYDH